jgi:hypothetical protein
MTRDRLQTILIVILAVVFVLLIIVAGALWERRAEQSALQPGADSGDSAGSSDGVDRSLEYYAARQESALITIKGPITALGNGCSLDNRCSMTVDGKTVQYSGGANEGSDGAEPGTGVLRLNGPPAIGTQVIITARSYSGGIYSTINCPECVIEPADPGSR